MSILIRDVWTPIWPNLAASALWAPAALWWHHSRLRSHISAEVAKIREELVQADAEPEGVSQ